MAYINNSRVGRYLAKLLGLPHQALNFIVSKWISVVVPLADILDTWEYFVYSVTLANNTAKTVSVTVPEEEEWAVQSILMRNPDDVARACNVQLKTPSMGGTNHMVGKLVDGENAVAAAWVSYPSLAYATAKELNFAGGLFVAPAGSLIYFDWAAGGASSGGTVSNGILIQFKRRRFAH